MHPFVLGDQLFHFLPGMIPGSVINVPDLQFHIPAAEIFFVFHKERMAALREHIEQVTGRQVKIELKVVSKNSEAAQEIEANDLSKINFAIQYE